jgi:hypothetical protein
VSVNFSKRRRYDFPNERELLQAAVEAREATGSCPTTSQLISFAMGNYGDGDPAISELKKHLEDCDSCIARLKAIRPPRGRQTLAPSFLKTRSFAAVAVALVVAAISFWAIRSQGPLVATVDLRQVVRGIEPSSINLNRNADIIRVLLPAGSSDGDYDLGIFISTTAVSPIRLGATRATFENGDVVIRVAISLKELRPGPYLLGIRHAGTEWAKYVVTVN